MFEGIILDIDDTLLVDGELKKEDIIYIQELKEKGYHILLATGRSLKEALPISKALNLGTPMVLLQGALTFYDNNSDRSIEVPLNKNTAKDIIYWCRTNRITPRVYIGELDYFYDFETNLEDNSEVFSNILQIRMEFENNDYRKERFEKYFENREDIITRIHPDSIDCLSMRTDKGVAVRRVAFEEGWSLSKFISVGNFPGDSMLFDETDFNIVIERKKEIKKTKNIQNISSGTVNEALKNVFNSLKEYKEGKYRKNTEIRIRSLGSFYYIFRENDVEEVDELLYDIWKMVNEEEELSLILRREISRNNFFEVIDRINYLISNNIIYKIAD